MKAKLIAKGYKAQLRDQNRLSSLALNAQGSNLRTQWNNSADKALSMILMYLDSYVATQFEHLVTSQTLLEGVRGFYSPDIEQEIERLKLAFSDLAYDG